METHPILQMQRHTFYAVHGISLSTISKWKRFIANINTEHMYVTTMIISFLMYYNCKEKRCSIWNTFWMSCCTFNIMSFKIIFQLYISQTNWCWKNQTNFQEVSRRRRRWRKKRKKNTRIKKRAKCLNTLKKCHIFSRHLLSRAMKKIRQISDENSKHTFDIIKGKV